MNLVDILKSQVGSIQGLWRSKKLALVVAFMTACVVLVVQHGAVLGSAPLWCAAVAVVAYVVAQAVVEFGGVWKGGEKPGPPSKE